MNGTGGFQPTPWTPPERAEGGTPMILVRPRYLVYVWMGEVYVRDEMSGWWWGPYPAPLAEAHAGVMERQWRSSCAAWMRAEYGAVNE